MGKRHMQKDKNLTFYGAMILAAANAAGRFGINPKEAERFLKFISVGVMGFFVDFTIFNILRFLVVSSVDTEPLQSRLIIAVTGVSLMAAITNNFFWNRYWTYPDSRSKPFWRQYGQFTLVNSSGFFIRTPIILFTRGWFGELVTSTAIFEPEIAKALGDNISLACAVFIVMFWNFIVNRYWTFNDVSS